MDSTITDALAGAGNRYVFVYGTLRRSQERDINRLQPPPVFVGEAEIKGTLYNLGAYPGIRLGSRGLVRGEVYQITPELECQLDQIEEVWPQETGEYIKREVVVSCEGTALKCLVYEAAQARINGQGIIASGDWATWLETTQGRFAEKD